LTLPAISEIVYAANNNAGDYKVNPHEKEYFDGLPLSTGTQYVVAEDPPVDDENYWDIQAENEALYYLRQCVSILESDE
jgi:hypothetical protein